MSRTKAPALIYALSFLLLMFITPLSYVFSQTTNNKQSVVTGTITYRQRIALPQSAVVQVELIDASRADAPAEVIATQTIEPKGKQVPIPFSLPYDAQKIQQNHDYRVQAKIIIDGRLAFTSTETNGVITRGKPTKINIVVAQLRGEVGPAPSRLEDTKWSLTEINGETVKTAARGESPYLQFTSSTKRVAGFSGCNRVMGGYTILGDRIKFGALAGTKMACPSEAMMAEAAFLKMIGAVTSYQLADGRLELYGDSKLLARFQSGPPPPGQAGLLNRRWILTELNGRAVTAKTRQEMGNLRFDEGNKSVSVFVGCNGMGGSYTLNDDKLKFEQLVGTMMFCNEETAKMEKAIGDALGAVTSYKLRGSTLELYGGGNLLARFEAKP